MRRFAALYAALDASTSTEAKVAALVDWLAEAPAEDAAWGVYFLSGGRPRQAVPSALLRSQAAAVAGIPEWLFEASYQAVGDLAETIAHVLPPPTQRSELGLADWVTTRLLPLRGQPPEQQAAALRSWWDMLAPDERFLLVKLIGGGFRVGVSKLLVQRALARHAGLDAKRIAERMMGWTDARQPPSAARLALLLAPELPAPDVAPAAAGQPERAGDETGAVAQGQEGTAAGGQVGSAGPASAAQPTGGQPYPFFLAHALDDAPPEALADRLGPLQDWLAEWKYDGIRAQLVRRAGQTWLWSRGEELITERFPDVVAHTQGLPDGCVLDGELLAWQAGTAPAADAGAGAGEAGTTEAGTGPARLGATQAGPAAPPDPAAAGCPAPFQRLQQRIQRKTLSRRLLAEVPVRFIAYDLLELAGRDLRMQPQHQRRAALQALLAPDGVPAMGGLGLSPLVVASSWAQLAAERQRSRALGVEGLMLKQREAGYGSGRTKADGVWWKWKIAPYTVDAVLVYAQAGHGRRAGLYTDYTFAVWTRPPADAAEAEAVVEAIRRRQPPQDGALQLVTFTKAYSGLSDAEFKRVDATIRAHTLEKFGPVRSVVPTLVFELAFEGIGPSPRHKSGIALRFPRMLRLRDDKPLWQADSLDTLRALIRGG